MHSVVPIPSVYAKSWGCKGPVLYLSLFRTIFSAIFSRQETNAMGLGFSGSFGLGMGCVSCSFQVEGLVLCVCVLFMSLRRISSPGVPRFAIIVYVMLSAPGAVSLPFLCAAWSSSSV